MRRRTHRHFLSHTLEHLIAVFVVLGIAVFVGVSARSSEVPNKSMLAQTSEGTWVDLSASSSTDPTLSLTEVSFSAQPAPEARCETGSPLTPVFLLATKATGGKFIISSDSGMSNAQFEWGEYPFPNGQYTWKASVNTGFIGVGDLSGAFLIANSCLGSTAPVLGGSSGIGTASSPFSPSLTPTTTTATNVATATVPVGDRPPVSAPTRPLLRLFVDNKPVATGAIFDTETIELRVTTVPGQKVSVSSIDAMGNTKTLGYAEKDDLLSLSGTDVWTLAYSMKKMPDGVYRFFATTKGKDGKETMSERTSVGIRHFVVSAKSVMDTNLPSDSSTMSTSVHVSPEEKRAILDRVADPASCMNEDECRIYCKGLPDENNQCLTYVRRSVVPLFVVGQSLTDGIAPARVAQMLSDSERRSKEIPEAVIDPEEFRQYCADMSHADICIKALVRNDMGRKETLAAAEENIIRSHNEEMNIFKERTGARVFIDTDNDGVSDYDEVNIYGTDPDKADTDGDGFPDGAEMLARTNPRGGEAVPVASSSEDVGDEEGGNGTTTILSDEFVRPEDPLNAGMTEPTLLSVSNTVVAEVGTDGSGSTTVKKIRIDGRAPANSFVTVYVFSDPIIVTVKADASGAWAYILDKQLLDGTHHVYAAINDVKGRILAKSLPFTFVKEAAVLSSTDDRSLSERAGEMSFGSTTFYALTAFLVGVLGVALSIAGYVVNRKKDTDVDPFNV